MKTLLNLLLMASSVFAEINPAHIDQTKPITTNAAQNYIEFTAHEGTLMRVLLYPDSKADRSTHPIHSTLYAREWQLIALLYRYSTPETAGVDPTGDAATNYDKLVTYAAGIADISTRMGVMADADRMQFLWAWCERERSKLGVTVGYGERYISL